MKTGSRITKPNNTMYKIEHIKNYLVESTTIKDAKTIEEAINVIKDFYWVNRSDDDLYVLIKYMNKKVTFEHQNYKLIIYKN